MIQFSLSFSLHCILFVYCFCWVCFSSFSHPSPILPLYLAGAQVCVVVCDLRSCPEKQRLIKVSEGRLALLQACCPNTHRILVYFLFFSLFYCCYFSMRSCFNLFLLWYWDVCFVLFCLLFLFDLIEFDMFVDCLFVCLFVCLLVCWNAVFYLFWLLVLSGWRWIRSWAHCTLSTAMSTRRLVAARPVHWDWSCPGQSRLCQRHQTHVSHLSCLEYSPPDTLEWLIEMKLIDCWIGAWQCLNRYRGDPIFNSNAPEWMTLSRYSWGGASRTDTNVIKLVVEEFCNKSIKFVSFILFVWIHIM
jgi:hypothetical protein